MNRFQEPRIADEPRFSAQSTEAYYALRRISDAERAARIAIEAALVKLRDDALDAYDNAALGNPISNEQFTLTLGAIDDAIADLTFEARHELRRIEEEG